MEPISRSDQNDRHPPPVYFMLWHSIFDWLHNLSNQLHRLQVIENVMFVKRPLFNIMCFFGLWCYIKN